MHVDPEEFAVKFRESAFDLFEAYDDHDKNDKKHSAGYGDTEGSEQDLNDAAAYGLTQVDLGMDDRVLDYHDCLLRVRDVALLTGANWLNDQILAFYFAYLSRDKYRHAQAGLGAGDGGGGGRGGGGDGGGGGGGGGVALVDGNIGFLVANMAAAEVAQVVAPLNLREADLVLFEVSTPLIHPSYATRTPLVRPSYTPHAPPVHPSHNPRSPPTHPSRTPRTPLMHPSHTPHTPLVRYIQRVSR
jgi:hypothetical protein